MAERLKRASLARLAVGMAALAFPLFAVGTAQAALGGGAPESSNRADLVSATALTSNTVDFCFDKPISNTAFTAGQAADFEIGGYRAANVIHASSANYEQTVQTGATAGTCVRVTFAGTGANTIGDIGQYTYASVLAGTGVTTLTGLTNYTAPVAGDSTALTVPTSLSPTHNGTTGFTIAPDLTSVSVDTTVNTITYTEDQAIANAPAASSFTFTRSGGTFCQGTGTPVVSGNTVTVTFAAATCPVADAVRAGQLAGALTAAADPAGISPPETVIVPVATGTSANATGTTSRPDLVSATLSADKTQISFVFDKSVGFVNPTQFRAITSLGNSVTIVPGITAIVVPGPVAGQSTVNVTFPFLSLYSEYVVEGAVGAGAVADVNNATNINEPDAVHAGDNAGAFARGFTTAPDATSAVINKTTGLVSINLDQRVITLGILLPQFVYTLDSTGTATIATPSPAIGIPSGLAGPQTITAQFTPAQVSTAVNVYIPAGSLVTNLLQSNPNQILAATTTSTLLKRAAYSRSHPQSKRFVEKHNAQVRKAEKRALRKLERKIHHKI